jgi:8-oxo-dGTP pyrophosphatase MutT (NUDIX family)
VKTAVCLLVSGSSVKGGYVPDNLFLAVSRRKNASRFGLPGGKVDPGESDAEAIGRETAEEVDLSSFLTDFQPLYAGFCPGKVNYWVTTYLWMGREFPLTGLTAEEGLVIDWLTRDELTNAGVSPFAKYNEGVFAAYDLWKQHA